MGATLKRADSINLNLHSLALGQASWWILLCNHTRGHHFRLNEALLSGEVHFSQIDKYCCNKDKHWSSTVARFWTRITTCHCYFPSVTVLIQVIQTFLGGPAPSTVLPWAVMLCIDNVSAINKEIDSSTVHQELPKQMVTRRESWGKKFTRFTLFREEILQQMLCLMIKENMKKDKKLQAGGRHEAVASTFRVLHTKEGRPQTSKKVLISEISSHVYQLSQKA